LNLVDKEKLKAIAGVTPEWVIEQLKNHALSSKSAADRIRSLELLGKTLALFKERSINENVSEKIPDSVDDLNEQFRELIKGREKSQQEQDGDDKS